MSSKNVATSCNISEMGTLAFASAKGKKSQQVATFLEMTSPV